MYYKAIFFRIQIMFCIVSYIINSSFQDKTLRIIGGRDAAPGEFPYVAKMVVKEKQSNDVVDVTYCTCTLLKPTWSLTAGHCVEQLRNLLSTLPSAKALIEYNITSDREFPSSKILSTFLHHNYVPFEKSSHLPYNDIGLLLSERMAVSNFGKLSPVDFLTLYGSKVLILGFGITISANGTYDSAHNVNKPIQVLNVIIIKCYREELYPSFCLGGLCGRTSTGCPGDSGGAVLHDSGVVGVVSGSLFDRCNAEVERNIKFKNFAGMMTPTSPYIDWVVNVIKSNSLI